jgi:hypothetical protein
MSIFLGAGMFDSELKMYTWPHGLRHRSVGSDNLKRMKLWNPNTILGFGNLRPPAFYSALR